MEIKDSGKRFKIILVFIILLLVPFVMYMRREHRLSKSRELFLLSRRYESSFRYNKALEVLYQAKELNPENPEIITRIGELYLRTGQEEKGLEILQSVIRDHPLYPESFYHLAFYFFHNKEPERARRYFQAFYNRSKDPVFKDIAKRRISEIDELLKDEIQ